MATATLDANRSCKIDIKDCQKVDGKLVATIQFATSHVTILSPSFGCPGVFEPGNDITLYVLADQLFLDIYLNDKKNNKNNLTEFGINYHLKLTHTAATKECVDKLMYAKGSAAANITCTYLDDLRPKTETDIEGNPVTLPAETRIRNKDGKLVACIRDSTLGYYLKGAERSDKAKPDDDGVISIARPHLFQIDLKPSTMQHPPTPDKFYDCSWFVANLKPNVPAKEKICEMQDLDCRQFVKGKSKEFHYLLPVKDGKVVFKKSNTPTYIEIDNDSSIQACHPFIVSSKPRLNIGQLSDVHISSRQVTFRKSEVRVLEGKLESNAACIQSPPTIGKLVNVTLDSFCDMFKQMAEDAEIDAIIITGDLIDYNQNFLSGVPIENAGDLWDKMHHNKHKEKALYPPYLDSLVLLSLLRSYYDKPDWKKPVFLVAGNHEHYKDIYGISPRILGAANKNGVRRANAGIPADHNLTIYEACLMYGPDYKWYSTDTFVQPWGDWFFRIFTPLTDYRFTFKEQSIVALGWGDDESIFNNNLFTHSLDISLPRACKSVSDTQLELLKAAAAVGSQRLLCAHFPFASYEPEHALGSEGKVNCNDFAREYDHFSQGTFTEHRPEVYQLLADNKFQFTLSGHSHRAGIYTGTLAGSVRPTYTVKGHEVPLEAAALPAKGQCNMVVSGSSGPIGVQNHYAAPLSFAHTESNFGKYMSTHPAGNQPANRTMVNDCHGAQEHKAPLASTHKTAAAPASAEKGLGGWGLDYPAGNRLTLVPGSETIKRIIPNIKNVPSAQPRFAVALDYMDMDADAVDSIVFGKERNSVFKSIVGDPTGSCFTFTVNPNLPATRFIEDIALVAYLGAAGKVYSMQVSEKGAGVLAARLAAGDKRVIAEKLASTKKPVRKFLHITFNQALSGIVGYKQYNFDSPWIYPVEIIGVKERQRKVLKENHLNSQHAGHQEVLMNGYLLWRHRDCGEIPDFTWYNDTFGYGFKFPKKTKKA
jgi:predicted MPP superfamily phosphohydrolase